MGNKLLNHEPMGVLTITLQLHASFIPRVWLHSISQSDPKSSKAFQTPTVTHSTEGGTAPACSVWELGLFSALKNPGSVLAWWLVFINLTQTKTCQRRETLHRETNSITLGQQACVWMHFLDWQLMKDGPAHCPLTSGPGLLYTSYLFELRWTI